MEENTKSPALLTIAALFLRLGITALGGPAAHIAMMRSEVVSRRKWMDDSEFLSMVSACNLIPGPNSTELAIHIGYRQGGPAGLLVAGLCFILPAAAIVIGMAAAYLHWAHLAVVGRIMGGVKPVILAVVVQAVFQLSRSTLKNRLVQILALAAFLACFVVSSELSLLFLAGAVSLFWNWRANSGRIGTRAALTGGAVLLCASALCLILRDAHTSVSEVQQFTLGSLFFYFLRIGSVLYGSGYVLLAFLQADLVNHWHWLSASQLLDATAVGQVTPGPVFTTATFIGYLLGGLPGALVATVGIFLPAFVFVAITAPVMKKLESSFFVSSILEGINACSLALMMFVSVTLARVTLVQPLFIIEFMLELFILMRLSINPTWLIVAGATAGAFL